VEVESDGDFDQDEIQVCGGLMDVALDFMATGGAS